MARRVRYSCPAHYTSLRELPANIGVCCVCLGRLETGAITLCYACGVFMHPFCRDPGARGRCLSCTVEETDGP